MDTGEEESSMASVPGSAPLSVEQLLEAVEHLSPAEKREFQRRLAARQAPNGSPDTHLFALYDEFDVAADGSFTHAILMTAGVEIRVRFTNLLITALPASWRRASDDRTSRSSWSKWRLRECSATVAHHRSATARRRRRSSGQEIQRMARKKRPPLTMDLHQLKEVLGKEEFLRQVGLTELPKEIELDEWLAHMTPEQRQELRRGLQETPRPEC
jgi:hypothetical protein